MRLLPGIFALLLLPVLMLAHRYEFHQKMQAPLEARVKAVLSGDPAFKLVQISMNYLDVSLKGATPDLAARDRAMERINQVSGVRCRAEDNHLVVPAQIEGSLKGERLVLTGLLHDNATLNGIARALMATRPSLKVDISGVALSPYAAQEEEPVSTAVRSLSPLITVPPSLKISRSPQGIEVSGFLPNEELASAVTEAIAAGSDALPLDRTHLTIGTYVSKAQFTDPDLLADFLKRLFALADSQGFEAREGSIRFSANVTLPMSVEWQALLEKLGAKEAIHADWHIFPSVYHLPTYHPVSTLDAASLGRLREALGEVAVVFEPDSVSIPEDEMTKISAAAQAITAAGPGVRIVVGGYVVQGEDSKASQSAARRRAEAVMAELVDRGLTASHFDAATFLVAPGQIFRNNQLNAIELIVK